MLSTTSEWPEGLADIVRRRKYGEAGSICAKRAGMVDRISSEHRSWLMSRVAAKNTLPELIVRRQAHAMGFRFRLHRRDLSGRPDLVFPKHRTVLFVHGCFWHRHPGCPKATTPKSRVDYWGAKFERNRERDALALRALEKLGWRALILWECETKDPKKIERVLTQMKTQLMPQR